MLAILPVLTKDINNIILFKIFDYLQMPVP